MCTESISHVHIDVSHNSLLLLLYLSKLSVLVNYYGEIIQIIPTSVYIYIYIYFRDEDGDNLWQCFISL